MKKLISINIFFLLLLSACNKLDIQPSASISSGNFFATQKDLEIAVSDLYASFLIKVDSDGWGDDLFLRAGITTAVTNATINSETNFVNSYWSDMYKGISRATVLLENMVKAKDKVSAPVYERIEGEARFLRAYYYSILISHFGDVVFYDKTVPLGDAYTLERTPKAQILQFIYTELDAAATKLPATYPASALKRANKGTALGIKARIALYMGDYATAKTATKAVIDLGSYQLYPNYRNLFLKVGETSSEILFSSPRSIAFNSLYLNNNDTRSVITRNAGGFGAIIPNWSAVDIYECTDGKTIDQSPLYDPHNPFANRDPRMTSSFVEFNTDWLGFIYQPHPDTLTVFSSKLGARVPNNDTRARAQFASYTGFVWKKRVDQSWSNQLISETPEIVLRYADILLMYAEAKIELNEIDASVADAINAVRARGYGVSAASTSYPKAVIANQAALRKLLRRERRVEMMWEGLRYMDLIRWKVAEKALNVQVPGLKSPTTQDRTQWPYTNTVLPTIDENGIVNYDAVISAGFAQKLTDYKFDVSKQYLWPIPASERLLNSKLTQNTGY